MPKSKIKKQKYCFIYTITCFSIDLYRREKFSSHLAFFSHWGVKTTDSMFPSLVFLSTFLPFKICRYLISCQIFLHFNVKAAIGIFTHRQIFSLLKDHIMILKPLWNRLMCLKTNPSILTYVHNLLLKSEGWYLWIYVIFSNIHHAVSRPKGALCFWQDKAKFKVKYKS